MVKRIRKLHLRDDGVDVVKSSRTVDLRQDTMQKKMLVFSRHAARKWEVRLEIIGVLLWLKEGAYNLPALACSVMPLERSHPLYNTRRRQMAFTKYVGS